MTKNSPMEQFFSPHNIKSADFVRNIFRQDLEEYFTKEDLTNPAKWRQIAKSNPALKSGDLIEVLREDNAFIAILLVTGKVNDDLFMKILTFINLDDDNDNETLAKESDFEITWKGPTKKFILTRKSDNKEIKDKFSSREEAKFWFKNNY